MILITTDVYLTMPICKSADWHIKVQPFIIHNRWYSQVYRRENMIYDTYYEVFTVAGHLARLNGMISQLPEGEYELFGQGNYLASNEVKEDMSYKDYRAYICIGGSMADYKDKLILAGWGIKNLAKDNDMARPVFAF